jgi:hypothetical protein
MRLYALLVGEAEASGFQTEYQHDLQYCDICHEFRNYSVTFRGEKSGIDRNEQKVDDACQNSAQTVNHGLSGQLFQGICHNRDKIN